MCRRHLLLLLLIATIFVGAVWLWPVRLRESELRNVRPGQSFSEVRALLGSPPGNYGDGKLQAMAQVALRIYDPGNGTGWIWYGQHEAVVVFFDEQEKVKSSSVFQVSRQPSRSFI